MKSLKRALFLLPVLFLVFFSFCCQLDSNHNSTSLKASFTFSPASPATGQAVQFTDTSAGSPTSWQWNFGDGTTSTAQNPSHAYTTAGSKTVTLTATNSSGSNSASRTVTVATALTASFTFSPASPATGQAVQFTDTSAGSPTSWQWSFGDGTTSTAQNPSHPYTTAGSYAVSLIASNSSGSSTATQIVNVAPASTLTASFSYSPGSPAPGQAVQFTDTSTGSPTSWQWSFGDGATSTSQNPSHAFAAVGSFTVTLVASNGSGPSSFSRVIGVDSPSTIIPTDRRIDWTYCGIPGGIPNRTTIYTTLSPGATAAQINTAINNCPSGQVVKLNAGTYNISGTILGKSNITLRGAGANKTIINSSVSSQCFSVDPAWSFISVAMSSGYTKGSMSVVVSSASNFQIGNLIMFDENDDVPDLGVMSSDGPERKFRTLARITGISSTTISFTPPLPYTLKSSLSPKAGYFEYGLSPTTLCGLEDLTLNSTGSGADVIFQWYGTDRCWMKSVEYSGGANIQVFPAVSLQFEMRHCYAHDVAGAPANGEGYGIYLYDSSSYCRVEDNIFYTMAAGILCSQTSANALLYNYAWKTTFNNFSGQFCMLNCNHGAYGLMSLWEGNMAEQWQNDSYHGTCGYQTLFRNWIHGLHPTSITNRKMIDLDSGSYYHNVVGNVLGDASWVPVSYEMTGQPDYAAQPCIYRLGYPNMTNNDLDNNNWTARYGVTAPDAKVRSTLLRHGNYDYKNNAVVWDGGITSHSIPASLFYASKPSYFGSLQWPPIGPDVSGLHTDIPAQARWNAYLVSGNKNDLF